MADDKRATAGEDSLLAQQNTLPAVLPLHCMLRPIYPPTTHSPVYRLRPRNERQCTAIGSSTASAHKETTLPAIAGTNHQYNATKGEAHKICKIQTLECYDSNTLFQTLEGMQLSYNSSSTAFTILATMPLPLASHSSRLLWA